MNCGGLPGSSVSAIVRPAGSGKTTFGIGFLRLATPERPAVHVGFSGIGNSPGS
jgi:circadian clock protein KaiC